MPDATDPPDVVVIAGPNGAGKSTAAPHLLRGVLGVRDFVNADVIAQGLSAFQPERVALSAGRIMLRRLAELAGNRESFAFETTLASRHFAPWIATLKREHGYQFHLLFVSLPSADLAVRRVSQRVRSGGHDVPAETVRRRFRARLRNFFELYRPLADTWRMYDNSGTRPRLIAAGSRVAAHRVRDVAAWRGIVGEFGHGPDTRD